MQIQYYRKTLTCRSPTSIVTTIRPTFVFVIVTVCTLKPDPSSQFKWVANASISGRPPLIQVAPKPTRPGCRNDWNFRSPWLLFRMYVRTGGLNWLLLQYWLDFVWVVLDSDAVNIVVFLVVVSSLMTKCICLKGTRLIIIYVVFSKLCWGWGWLSVQADANEQVLIMERLPV